MDIEALNHGADTEIKVFMDVSDNTEAERHQLEEVADAFDYLKDSNGFVLRLAENIQGNIFNRPFPYIALRHMSSRSAKRIGHDRDDGDPHKDYFYTLRSVARREIRDETVGFVFMGFKVLDNAQVEMLDLTWPEWSGAREMLRALDGRGYVIKRVTCLKGVNQKADVFKYSIVIEFGGESMSDVGARDALQRFRIRRMSGYVALYDKLNEVALRSAIKANEDQDARAFNLVET